MTPTLARHSSGHPTNWTELRFGRHKGKSLPQVLFVDPDWFFWALGSGALPGGLLVEAEDLSAKVRRVKVPPHYGPDVEVEYLFNAHSGKFSRLTVVPANQAMHVGSSPCLRNRHIDFSVPVRQARYDKSGYALFLQRLKYVLFGTTRRRMTKQRCEEFFSNHDNFEL